MHTEFYSDNLKRRDRLGDTGVDVRIILERILENYNVKVWT